MGKRSLLRRGFALLVVLVALGGAGLIWQQYQTLKQPLGSADQQWTFTIEPGNALQTVARKLHNQGLLSHPQAFVQYAKFKRLSQSIQTGEYALNGMQTPIDLLTAFTQGQVVQYPVQFLEGWRVTEMLDALHEHGYIEQTLDASQLEILGEQLGLPTKHAEGWFYPDTYLVTRGTKDIDVLKRAHQKMLTVLESAWASRADGLPINTPYEALTLASIIEKETAVADERTQVAGVFTNRLKKGMRLQTDPTVIYGVIHTQGEAAYRGDITRQHLVTDTPYNTYTRSGLPPTPIGAASEAALQAALNPAATKALYFVATGNNDGRHVFSPSLKAHNEAVGQYLRRYRQQHSTNP